MEEGIRESTGSHVGKTIVFARNHLHAVHLSEVFTEMYPQYGSAFCRVIDNQEPKAEQRIDDFKNPENELTIAISVDMLHTGIDVPEVVNLGAPSRQRRARSLRTGTLGKMRGIVPRRYSTSTLIDSVSCVPWLAAEGPLAYTPENPPGTDYFFQYSWILPEVFNANVHKRRHHYFGTPIRDHAKPLFEFWRQARRREVDRVYLSLGSFAENRVRAPVAVYRAKLVPHDESDQWLFIQHGSYQWISSAAQPHVEEGEVLLYRGIQQEETFRYPSVEQGLKQPANQRTWQRYLALQWSMLSDSSLSFNTIHDRTKRCETAYLNDGTWLADRLAAEAGLDVESDRFAHVLWEAATSAFSLECWVAERKFGPHFVVAKTPIANIRLTTFFAGEAEVRLVDPSQIRVLESVGCTVAT